MGTHDCLFPRHDGFAPVEADDAGWIILPGRRVAKRSPTNGGFGPMSGQSLRRERTQEREPASSLITLSNPVCQSGSVTPNASRSFVVSSTENAGRIALVG
jgi:hypothetical protein